MSENTIKHPPLWEGLGGTPFEIEMEVRDYECDLQGIVNNANYLHYLEHTRHKYIETLGLSFSDLHDKGIDVVVARMTLNYKVPLRPEDKFISRIRMEKEGLRYIFHQTILRKEDKRVCLMAKVEAVCIVNGKLGDSEEVNNAFMAAKA